MKNLTTMIAPSLVSTIRLVAFSFALLTPILAQQNPPNPQPQARDNRRELRDRDENITLLERGKDEARNRQTVLAQMNEDFARIQSTDKEILSAISTDTPDYKLISEGLADIRKRAMRLKNNLVLPPTAKDEKAQKKRDDSDTSQLRPALTTLNSLITSFVTNPLFNKDTGVDYTLVARARRDLDGIIEFSERIRKSAENLNKIGSKPNN
jgi:hypothetical protein